MARSMQHLNGDLLCAIDIETTGTDPSKHEIIQICILPLDSNIEPIKDLLPFYIEMKPDYLERIEPEAASVNRITMAKIALRGFDHMKASDMLEDWVNKINLPYTKYGTRKRLVPLGQNYTFDRSFIMNWLGLSLYEELFDVRYRDTMTAALFLNDRSSFVSEPVPFPKVNLAYLANQLNVPHEHAHDALQDCLVVAQVYRKMLTCCNLGLLG